MSKNIHNFKKKTYEPVGLDFEKDKVKMKESTETLNVESVILSVSKDKEKNSVDGLTLRTLPGAIGSATGVDTKSTPKASITISLETTNVDTNFTGCFFISGHGKEGRIDRPTILKNMITFNNII